MINDGEKQKGLRWWIKNWNKDNCVAWLQKQWCACPSHLELWVTHMDPTSLTNFHVQLLPTETEAHV